MNLLPHQSGFVREVLSGSGHRVVILAAEAGSGKTTALRALVENIIKKGADQRALMVVSSGLVAVKQIRALDAVGVPWILLDRYRFRELLEEHNGHIEWPAATVVLVNLDLAIKPDVAAALNVCEWSVIAVDEAHLLKGPRAKPLLSVLERSQLVVLSTFPRAELDEELCGVHPRTIQWDRADLFVGNGASVDTVPRAKLVMHGYELGQEEINLQAILMDLRVVLQKEAALPPKRWKALGQAITSSTSQLERVLQRLDGEPGLNEGHDTEDQPSLDGGGVPETATLDQVSRELIDRAMTSLEAISEEGKAKALVQLVQELTRDGTRKVCLLTSYHATLYYLAAVMESSGLPLVIVSNTMSWEDRSVVYERFSDTPGILLGSRTLVEELADIKDWTDLVLYELPSSVNVARLCIGPFDGVLRSRQLNVHCFVPTNAMQGLLVPDTAPVKAFLSVD